MPYIRIDPERHTGTQVWESRTIKGHTYLTPASTYAPVLVRRARQDYPEDGIARGDVYFEMLTEGSHNSGTRYTVAEAVRLGYGFVDEPTFDYWGPERGFEPTPEESTK